MLIRSILASLLLCLVVIPVKCHADLIFNFSNNSELDDAGIGASMTVGSVTLTTVGFEYPDLSSAPTVGSILNTAGRTNILSTGGLGVDNPTIAGTAFQNNFGPANEQSNFNFDEAWVFKSNTAISFDSISFASIDAGDVFTATIGSSSFSLANNSQITNPFNNLVVAAGTSIKFAFSGNSASSQARITAFNITAVPEPSSFLLGSIAACSMLAVRRRRK